MTKAEKIAALAELRSKAETLVMSLNDGVQSGTPNPTMEKVDQTSGKNIVVYISDELEQIVNRYTALAREIAFDECKAADDPMLEAIKRLTFTTIGVKETKKGEEKIPVSEVANREMDIDLLKLHKSIEGGIGKDPKWNGFIEKFNFHMTARQAKRIVKGKENLTRVLKEINDSYSMCKVAQEIEMGKDPTSNTKLLASLQTIINAMIGEEYKATSHDVNYLVDLYATKGKGKLKVNCANHRFFRKYIAAICHGIVTGEDYEVCFKKVNAK
ncbi:MAG: hypothetical protein IJY30_02325 [Muribaculaceae bacterium]|nr:hypothetical protein [Muribaculaceae bacterium]